MLIGVTWQMIIILLVLIEVVVNIILLLLAFHVIRGMKKAIYGYCQLPYFIMTSHKNNSIV